MAVDRSELSERMAKAARDLQGERDAQSTMDAGVRLMLENVRGADAVGLSVAHRRRKIATPAHTHDFVVRADELQNELQEGPCRDAIWEARIVHSADLEADDRWPRWGPQIAEELGIHSMLCFRLFTNEDLVGGLNLYSKSKRGFDEEDRDDGLALAAHISVAVAAAQKMDQLETAVDRRTTIGQAVGILMERYDLDQDRAYAVLARISSHTNTKLFDIAAELVRTRRLPQSPTTSS